ncbi:MAG: NAD(P)-binding protein [Chromatiales bacterium]|nr:NAD(P)-binding protein [Gammaproteobacteria bacterium]MCP5230628.1 NAD(P)-binding protein [Zoogloeaceae bacterium]MCP5352889.1 NAD(P)-binding protein [Chromatiales bacterium]MCP5438869.1 NAD(P)-binding protein [Chromatiaceae bacterium]
MATPWSKTHKGEGHTFRKFKEGNYDWRSWGDKIFNEDKSHKCPTYVLRTPPCQGSCPSGEDIRGWLQIVRGIEKAPAGMDWTEYAFRRSTEANPFPSQMGRVCPAPCQDGCNRNEVDDFVGINAVEQFIGDTAFKNGYKFERPDATSGKKVAIIGGGPAGMAAAYQLRKKGHASVIIEAQPMLGGMMRYGIPGYRTPREVLGHEIQRIIDMGDIEVRTNTRVGKDVTIEQLEADFDAIVWAIGCQTGRGLPVEGWDGTPNCVSGVAFLDAFNKGTLQVTASKVVCVGGGDTSIDVVSVARRLGHIENINANESAEQVIHGYVAHDAAHAAKRQGATVTLTSLFPKSQMTAAEHEVHDALYEGVDIQDGVMPIGLVKDANGRATGLKMAKCEMKDGRPVAVEGSEYVIEADLIVSAIGQGGDMKGIEAMGNERNLINADKHYQVPGKPKHFVCGDIIRPHLLTTAIGQASVMADSIDGFFKNQELKPRPKVDVHHWDLMEKLHESGLDPAPYTHENEDWGTSSAKYAVHNFENRSNQEIVHAEDMFLGHFKFEERYKREEVVPSSEEVLGHFAERVVGLATETAQKEAERCMSCGLCFECDNCVIFCPQTAVFRVKKSEATTGRYVDTDYTKCIGCHICSDVCPTGYIDMAMGEG